MDEKTEAKKLGFGLMRLPLTNADDEASIDLQKTQEMVDLFIERGFTYFDTAWMYCGFASESAVKKVLVDRYPRDRFTLATKLHSNFIKTKEDRDRIFNEQLRKTGVEYFDYYLIHDVGAEHYEIYQALECFDWLREKKAQGLVRNIGFSFHDHAALLDRILNEQPGLDFVQLQINYLDWDSEGVQSRKCYETARKHGLPVIVMEPVKGGTLAQLPKEAAALLQHQHPDWSVPSWAIRFAAGLPGVMMVLSGMSNMEQVLDNTSYMSSFSPLTEQETDTLRQVVDTINRNIAIACTGCSYCTDGCPMSIAIPRYFSLYNADKQEIEGKGWTIQRGYYDNLTKVFGKAGDCIACGQCESACPQHLPIIRHLKEVAAHFER
ncbi:MAG: aldo/keto reductase [Acutalibacteraceae bacterium]